jgi:hypothetical protein
VSKKAKFYKSIISAIALFSFIHWGLDRELLCKLANDTPQTCGYLEDGSIVKVFGTGFAVMLTAMAVAILTTWIRKD